MSRARILALSPVLGALALLSACEKRIEAPTETGMCYQVTQHPDGKVDFFVVARNQPTLEHCGARLEEVRMRFIRLGSFRREMVGAYQGRFLFLDSGGLSVAQKLDGGRFNALARTRDGRLAVPSYIVQPDGTGGQGGPRLPESAPAVKN